MADVESDFEDTLEELEGEFSLEDAPMLKKLEDIDIACAMKLAVISLTKKGYVCKIRRSPTRGEGVIFVRNTWSDDQ